MPETAEQATSRKFKEALYKSMGRCMSYVVSHGNCWNRARFYILPLGYRFCRIHAAEVMNVKNLDTYTVHTLSYP